ncbi:MAG: hypothetical protein ACO3NW_07885 [Kiritimatiellia bacterium]
MKSLVTFRLLMVLCVFVPQARAQEEPEIQTELLALALGEPMGELYFQSEEKVRTLNFGMVGLGRPVSYRGPAHLGLCLSREKAATVLPPDHPGPLPADHRISLHPPADRMLILGHKQKGRQMFLSVLPLPTQTFRPGQFLLFNLSGHTLRIRLGTDLLSLDPGRRSFLQPAPPSGEDPDLDVRIVTEIDGDLKLVYSSVIAHDPTKRTLIFFFNGGHPSMPLQLRFLHDRVPPPAEPAP